MINTENFLELVYGFWAQRFEYEALTFDRPCTYIYEDDSLAGTGKAVLYQIGEMSIARLGADLLAQIRLEQAYPCAIKTLDVDGLRETLEERFRVDVEYTLLDWFLDAERHIPQAVPAGFTARQMDGEQDDAILQAFYGAASGDDLEKAEILVDEPDPVIFGLFDGAGQMAAYASHRYWEDLLCDIGVLVHPNFRGQGLGAAAVSTLCRWCIENEKIPMYRVMEDNPHSLTIPRALGFQMIVRVDALRISKEA